MLGRRSNWVAAVKLPLVGGAVHVWRLRVAMLGAVRLTMGRSDC